MLVPRKVWLQTLCCDADRLGATAHHSPSIVSVEPLTIELRLEGDPSGVREFGTIKVFGQIALG